MSDKADKRVALKTAIRTLGRFGWTIKKHWPFALLGLCCSATYSFTLTFQNPRLVGRIVDIVGAGGVPADQVFSVFGPIIVQLIITNIICQIASKVQDYSVWKLQILGSFDLSRLVFDTISTQSMTFHNNRFGGSLVSQTSKFTNAYNQLVQIVIYNLSVLIMATIFTVVILLPLAPYYVLALAILLAVYMVVVFVMFRRILHINSRNAEAQNELSGELSDSITNILAVKTFGRESYERKLFSTANEKVRSTGAKGMRSSLFSAGMAAAIIVVVMTVLTFFIAGGNAWFGISAGTLVMMYSYTNALVSHYNYFPIVMQNINRAMGDAQEMTRILDEPRLVEDAPDAKPMRVDEGRIAFSHIGFSYTDTDVPQEIFRDFHLDIKPGERIGLVGRSGSGKTTLTRLLLRLADIGDGTITIDGQDIAGVTQESLRQNIGYVPQEPLLFHRTIAENIAYGKPDATPEEIKEAARRAYALDFIEKLPNGMDTITGERGVKLSGGQRQRIAIARAILADAPILVLDEATSALDSESEQAIQKALIDLMKDRTSIVVAHRLSTVASLDRIILLEDGKIVEDGTHKELIAQNGVYANLWDRQTGAFLE